MASTRSPAALHLALCTRTSLIHLRARPSGSRLCLSLGSEGCMCVWTVQGSQVLDIQRAPAHHRSRMTSCSCTVAVVEKLSCTVVAD